MRRVFVYKLKPTAVQEAGLDGYLDATRHLYNAALEHRIAVYKATGKGVSRFEQEREIKDVRRLPGWEDLAACNTNPLHDAIIQLDKSYQSFFRRVERGERAGFPRFKSAGRWNSFVFATYGHGVSLDEDAQRLRVSKVGSIRVRLHRPLEGRPTQVRIVRKVDGWYAHIVCDVGVAPPKREGDRTALDLGIESFATLAGGEQIENPRHLRTAHRDLVSAQRSLARKRRGSNRRRKQRDRVALLHLKVARSRRDFHHKLARRLVDDFAGVAVEDLRTANLMRHGPFKRGLNRSIADAGWAQFVEILTSKAEEAGTEVVKVDPRNTSQACSGCGAIVKKGLGVRQHDCQCGTSLHRDHNAALNILNRAWAVPFVEGAELRPVKREAADCRAPRLSSTKEQSDGER